MSTIPQEYLIPRSQEDFGFTAVDEGELTPSYDPNTLETEVIRTQGGASAEGIARLESKIDTILDLYNNGKLGLDAARAKLQAEVKSNLTQLEQLVVPLLVNLMKNPEKEYIHWPNRVPLIEKQIERILAITRA